MKNEHEQQQVVFLSSDELRNLLSLDDGQFLTAIRGLDSPRAISDEHVDRLADHVRAIEAAFDAARVAVGMEPVHGEEARS